MSENKKNKHTGLKVAIGLGAILLIGGVFAVSCIEKINAGYVGVVYTPSSGVSETTLNAGWHFVSPFKKVTAYTVALEQAYLSEDSREGSKENESFPVISKDGNSIIVDVEFSYRFDSDRIPDVFKRFRGQSGEQIEKSFMRGKIKTWASEATSQFAVIDIYSDRRAEVNATAFKHVKENFEEYGIIIESFNFSRIGLDNQTAQAIQDRVNAQQELEKKKIEVENTKMEAERKKAEAQGEADKLLIEANAKADAMLIEAQGESESNKLLQKTLTPEMLQSMWIQAWDGKLSYVSGANSTLLELPIK
ncbi:MAG: SPFH domain-containing protein [Synergistaceae bacterium]